MINKNFPVSRFSKTNDIRKQLHHLLSEVEEIYGAYQFEGMERTLEELADLHHSLETFWIIAEREFGEAAIGSIFLAVKIKNAARGYYEPEGE